MRGAGLLILLSLGRMAFSLSAGTPVFQEPPPDALPELLEGVEEERRLDSIRSSPLLPGEGLDPNRVGVDELDRLPGIGPTVARAIVTHRSSGQGFREVDDLLLVPGIGPATLNRIRPFLDLSRAPSIPRAQSLPPGPLVDLNRADSEELQELPGIGPAIAERIMESRKRDGPFRTVDDLLRVQGIGPVTLSRIRPLIHARRIS